MNHNNWIDNRRRKRFKTSKNRKNLRNWKNYLNLMTIVLYLRIHSQWKRKLEYKIHSHKRRQRKKKRMRARLRNWFRSMRKITRKKNSQSRKNYKKRLNSPRFHQKLWRILSRKKKRRNRNIESSFRISFRV